MTSSITDGLIVQEIGAPPPFDPELSPIAEMLAGIRPPDAYRLDTIEQMRAPVPGVESPTDEVLTRGGTYRVEERVVPGPDGHPDISLLICLPLQVSAPTAAIYHVHGGGMIVGDSRFALVEMLDLAAPLGAAVVSVEYRLAPRHVTLARLRTAMPAWSGWPRMPPNSASTPNASSSPGRAQAADSPPPSP